jgi:hypothetical protein
MMLGYGKQGEVSCKCGKMARIVRTGVGSYVYCPHCGADTYMCTSMEEAVRRFKEQQA